jgi:hypothetical protein
MQFIHQLLTLFSPNLCAGQTNECGCGAPTVSNVRAALCRTQNFTEAA